MSDRSLRIVALTSAVALEKSRDVEGTTPLVSAAVSTVVPRKRFETIFVATDGTPAGDRALTYAIELACEHGAVLEICSVVDSSAAVSGTALSGGIDGAQISRVLEDAAREILARASASAKQADIASSASIVFGHPAEAIVKASTEKHADTIVVGTRGKNGLERFFLGSTAWDVLRASAIPTIVVPPNLAPHATSYRVLVALDASERSDATLRFALRLAAKDRATLLLCSVVETRDLYEKAATYGYDYAPVLAEFHITSNESIRHHAAVVERHDLPHEVVIVEGEAAKSILMVARQHRADAIVIGTHGRRGVERLFLGSVAEAVVREATVPVAVIRTQHRDVPAV